MVFKQKIRKIQRCGNHLAEAQVWLVLRIQAPHIADLKRRGL